MNPEDQEKNRMQQRIDDADAELQKVFKAIFKKAPHELTVEDKRFLQARVSYLGNDHKEKYADALEEKLPRPDGQEDEEEQLVDKSRKELEQMANDLGIEDASPKAYSNKEKLVEAIEEKQKENPEE